MTCSISLGAGSIYDFYFLKQGGGHWNAWTEYITKEEETIPANAKVKKMLWFLEFSKVPSKWKNHQSPMSISTVFCKDQTLKSIERPRFLTQAQALHFPTVRWKKVIKDNHQD